jgi:4-hydroxy-tetrahydrodipicolinate synthase
MVSPFESNGSIDLPAVGRLVAHLLAHGASDAIFVLGTTGECSSIPPDQQLRLVRQAVACVRGRATVYAGIGGNCLSASIESARAFAEAGVDAVVAYPPSYYPIDDREMHAYFESLARGIPLPLVLYNIPITTRLNIAIDIVERLSKLPNVVAIKDSTSDANRIAELLTRFGGRGGFPVLLGSSPLFPAGLRLGGVGIIPSGSHVAPMAYQRMMQAADNGDWAGVDAAHAEASAACEAYLSGRTLPQSLAQLKFLMEQKGLCRRTVLPPLLEVTDPA